MSESPDAEMNAVRGLQYWPVPGLAFSDVARAVTGTTVVPVFGAALLVILWRSRARHEAIALSLLSAVLPLAQAGLKQLVDRPRPPEELIRAGYSSPSSPPGM